MTLHPAIYLVCFIVWVYCWAILARRLGYRAAYGIGLLMAIPFVNLAMFLFMVLRESPNERRLRGAVTPDEESPLGGVPVEELEESCLQCGAAMPSGRTRCAACGWSYDTAARE